MHSVWINLLALLAVALVVGAYIKFNKLNKHSDDWKKIVKE